MVGVQVHATAGDEVERQAAYHEPEFTALRRWDEDWRAAVDWAGDEESVVDLGLDQSGHFGSNGVELIGDRLAAAGGPLGRVVELGSGLGGVLRQIGRDLRSRGLAPTLIGVELVPGHCELAQEIGRTVGDTMPTFVNADVRQLPLPSACADAVFATGSASHFTGMADVLAESRRVLRPGGVLAMTEEVSLRPAGGPPVGDEFLRRHPPAVFPEATREQRRAELEAAGLEVEAFESLRDWAGPLLRERAQVLRMLEGCTRPIIGDAMYESSVAMLECTADEYERGSVEPVVIVARRPSA